MGYAGGSMAVNKYHVGQDCEPIQDGFPGSGEEVGKYPFKMINFIQDGENLGIRTSEDFVRMPVGHYPKAGEDTKQEVSDKINDSNANNRTALSETGFRSVRLCEDNEPFAQKGTSLRLPLKGFKRVTICTCQCGKRYEHFIFHPIVTPIEPPNFPAGSAAKSIEEVGRAFLSESKGMAISCGELRQGLAHLWIFGTHLYVTAKITNTIPHPKCPSISMVEISWVTVSRVFGSYSTVHPLFPFGTENIIWKIDDVFVGPTIGPPIGVFCEGSFGITSDSNQIFFSEPIIPSQPTLSDYPESANPPCEPNFPSWEVPITEFLVEKGSFQDCDAECECP